MLTRSENADFAARRPDLLHLSPEALTQLGELSALDPSELVVEYACRTLSYGYLGSDGLQERALTRAHWTYEVYELARAEL